MSDQTRDPRRIKAMSPEELVTEFQAFVGGIVTRLRRQLHIRIAIEDLEAYGYEGLLEAHDRYDPDAGAVFASFAYYRVRGAILDGCRKEGWLSRDRGREASREAAIDQYMQDLATTERAAPAPTTMSDALDRVAAIVDDAATIYLLHDSDVDLVTEPTEGKQHERLERKAEKRMLHAAMAVLNDEEREIIIRHHFENEAMDDIAETFGHSRSWVSRVNTRAIQRMREYFLANE